MKHQNDFKIATWNLCLGLANKKDLVSKTIVENEIDVCVMQEIDIGYQKTRFGYVKKTKKEGPEEK